MDKILLTDIIDCETVRCGFRSFSKRKGNKKKRQKKGYIFFFAGTDIAFTVITDIHNAALKKKERKNPETISERVVSQ